jgi:hypothetical protein
MIGPPAFLDDLPLLRVPAAVEVGAFLVNSTSELLESVESEDSTLIIFAGLLLPPSSGPLVIDLSSDLAFLTEAEAGVAVVGIGAAFSLLTFSTTTSGSLKA